MKKHLFIFSFLFFGFNAQAQFLELGYGRGIQEHIPSALIGYDINNYLGAGVKVSIANEYMRKAAILELSTNKTRNVRISVMPEVGISNVLYATWNVRTFYKWFYLGLGSFENKALYQIGFKLDFTKNYKDIDDENIED